MKFILIVSLLTSIASCRSTGSQDSEEKAALPAGKAWVDWGTCGNVPKEYQTESKDKNGNVVPAFYGTGGLSYDQDRAEYKKKVSELQTQYCGNQDTKDSLCKIEAPYRTYKPSDSANSGWALFQIKCIHFVLADCGPQTPVTVSSSESPTRKCTYKRETKTIVDSF